MTNRISGIIPLLVITLLCVGAVEGGYMVLEYFILRQPVEENIRPMTPATDGETAPPETKPDHKSILTRNLFGPTRPKETPPTPTAIVADNLELTGLGIVLVGTISGSEGTPRAIILDLKSHKQALYKAGDVVQGANILDIRRGKVILSVNGKDELLDMSEAATVRPKVKIPMEPPPQVFQSPDVSAAVENVPPQELGQPVETAPENVSPPNEAAPGNVAPPNETAPENVSPQNKENEPPGRRIVRPRIIRPYRPSDQN